MSFDHDLPNVVQHKISSWIVFILWPTCVILQSEFAVGDHISTKYRSCQKCQKFFNIIHISWWYIFCHYPANLCDLTIWILSRRSSSCFRSWKPAITGLIINQLAVIALKLKTVTHILNIAENGIEKYSIQRLWKYSIVSFYCQLRCYSKWKRYCQILPRPQQTWR